MSFSELFEWYDIAIKDNQTENQKAEAERKRIESESKLRRGK
jgi:hypothetical protein